MIIYIEYFHLHFEMFPIPFFEFLFFVSQIFSTRVSMFFFPYIYSYVSLPLLLCLTYSFCFVIDVYTYHMDPFSCELKNSQSSSL